MNILELIEFFMTKYGMDEETANEMAYLETRPQTNSEFLAMGFA